MALKATICKLNIALSDLDRNYFDTLNLTIAQHPSETIERMMVRVLVFCLNAQENLQFTKGLSAVDEPDLWVRTLDGRTLLWLDVGEPSADRMKKARRLAPMVKVYSFNSKSNAWWDQGRKKFADLNVSIFRLNWQSVQSLAALQQRTMVLSMTLTENSAYIATESGECEVTWEPLQLV
ncbi:MAG: hypothetical protein ACI8W7_003357 [Gammaproteobacteria bacterium]